MPPQEPRDARLPHERQRAQRSARSGRLRANGAYVEDAPRPTDAAVRVALERAISGAGRVIRERKRRRRGW